MQVTVELEKLIFRGDSQQFNEVSLGDIQVMCIIEPVSIEGFLCENLDCFLQWYICEEGCYIVGDKGVIISDL